MVSADELPSGALKKIAPFGVLRAHLGAFRVQAAPGYAFVGITAKRGARCFRH
jgi:hypothetical protein